MRRVPFSACIISCPQIMLVFLSTAFSKKSEVPYIRQQGRPLNIAHRGLTSVFPQNTMQSMSAAMYMGADFVEFDICYTREFLPLIMHDPYLSRITDVALHPQFADRKHNRSFEGKFRNDWWTDNFTLQELQTLKIKQDQAPGRINTVDYYFTFPILNDIIEYGIAFNKLHKGKRNPDGRLVGLLIEAKSSEMYRQLYNRQIGLTILQTLKLYGLLSYKTAMFDLPIYLHSFDFQTVKFWSTRVDLPISFLFTSASKDINFTDISQYANSVGFNDLFDWDYNSNKSKGMIKAAQNSDLLVHMWTFKDDMLFFNCANSSTAYRLGKELGLDGIITEFTDTLASMQGFI